MNDINLFEGKGFVYLREVRSKEEVLDFLNCSQGRSCDEPDGFFVRGSEKVCRSIIASLSDKGKLKGGDGKKKIVAFEGGNDTLNRRAIESLKIDYLVSVEGDLRDVKMKDTLKQRDSGLNHVVARMAKEKGVGIVVDMGRVARLKGKEKAIIISRIIQNVKMVRKTGCKMKIASFGREKGEVFDEKGRRAFGVSLGMDSRMSRDCVKF